MSFRRQCDKEGLYFKSLLRACPTYRSYQMTTIKRTVLLLAPNGPHVHSVPRLKAPARARARGRNIAINKAKFLENKAETRLLC